jgi:hypothetical protein
MDIIESEFFKDNNHQAKLKKLTCCIIGSGTSPFPINLCSKGFQEVTVIDSEEALSQLRELHGDATQQGLHLLSTDITNSKEANSDAKPFDLVRELITC